MEDSKRLRNLVANRLWGLYDELRKATTLREFEATKKSLKVFEEFLGEIDSELGTDLHTLAKQPIRELYSIVEPKQ